MSYGQYIKWIRIFKNRQAHTHKTSLINGKNPFSKNTV